jgi:hypothetical protein
MGFLFSKPSNPAPHLRIEDKYETVEQVYEALREAGVEACQLILAIDFTGSNTMHSCYGGRSLHHVDPNGLEQNPYQRAMRLIALTLEKFDPDHLIPVYGFGDSKSKGRAVFNLRDRMNGAELIGMDEPCNGLAEVDYVYRVVAPTVHLDGPTSFAPAIMKAIDIVKQTKEYHVLLIIADGQITDNGETIKAVVEASRYPLSIVCVGVGDGPWKQMEHLDDDVKGRKVDNFQFTDFMQIDKTGGPYMEARFAVSALQEIPAQYHYFRKHKMLG